MVGPTNYSLSKCSTENGILTQLLSSDQPVIGAGLGGNLSVSPTKKPTSDTEPSQRTSIAMNIVQEYYVDRSRRVPGSPDSLTPELQSTLFNTQQPNNLWTSEGHTHQNYSQNDFGNTFTVANYDSHPRRSSQIPLTSNQSGPSPRLNVDPSAKNPQYLQTYQQSAHGRISNIQSTGNLTNFDMQSFQTHSGSQQRNTRILGEDIALFCSNDDFTWTLKHPLTWTVSDVEHWMKSIALEFKLNLDARTFEPYRNMDGATLTKMDWGDFIQRDPINGNIFFFSLEKIARQSSLDSPVKIEPAGMNHPATDHHLLPICSDNIADISAYLQDPFSNDEFDDIPDGSNFPVCGNNQAVMLQSNGQPQQYFQTYNWSQEAPKGALVFERKELDSDADSNRSSSVTFASLSPAATDWNQNCYADTSKKPKQQKAEKKGGNRNKQGTRGNHLWEFIRDLLKNKENSALIRWEDKSEGVFRLVDSDKVARMWGEKKSNSRMTYEKLSRAMRYYYKSEILEAVPGRRLVYKFGPKATGWKAVAESS